MAKMTEKEMKNLVGVLSKVGAGYNSGGFSEEEKERRREELRKAKAKRLKMRNKQLKRSKGTQRVDAGLRGNVDDKDADRFRTKGTY